MPQSNSLPITSSSTGHPRRDGNGGRGSRRGYGGTGAAGTGEKEHRRELHLFNQIATITADTLDLQEIINEILTTVLAFLH